MNLQEIKKLTGVDPEQISESAWEPIEYDPDGMWRKDRAWIVKPHGDKDGISIVRKVNLFEEELLKANRDQYDTPQSFLRKGELDAKAASVPQNVFYRDIAGKMQEGDKDHLKWWLNSEAARPYRTIKGKI